MIVEWRDVGVEAVRLSSLSFSSGRELRDLREPNMLVGRPAFCVRDRCISLSMLLLESALLMGVEELDDGICELVGELEGVVEKAVIVGRRFLSRPPTGMLSRGSSIGVNAETGGGRKMLKDFRRRL